MGARWLFITGVAALFGAAAASVARFGGEAELPVAAGAWIVASLGLVLFGDAQLRTAGMTVGELLSTSIGQALLWRAAALALAGMALLVARSSAARRVAMLTVFVAALVSMAVHAVAGHSAAVERLPAAAIGLQWVHFAAAGVWVGGLAALVAGTRGEPDVGKMAAVRRYSTLAGIALATVAVTGILRTAQGLSSWNELVATDYGKAALAKASLLVAIATLGAVNRWRNVPAASTDLRPLRQVALVELVLMVAVLGVAAILATLPPPR
jgi:putative copper export protein